MVRRIHIHPANRRRISWLLHNIRIRRAIRAINAAIPGEAIRPPGHAAAGDEAAGALLTGHASQLPFAGFSALRRFLRRKRQGEDKKTSKEDVAHGAASPGKVNGLLTNRGCWHFRACTKALSRPFMGHAPLGRPFRPDAAALPAGARAGKRGAGIAARAGEFGRGSSSHRTRAGVSAWAAPSPRATLAQLLAPCRGCRGANGNQPDPAGRQPSRPDRLADAASHTLRPANELWLLWRCAFADAHHPAGGASHRRCLHHHGVGDLAGLR